MHDVLFVCNSIVLVRIRAINPEKKISWDVLEWPSESPDLKATEYLWCDLKKAVAAWKPSNITELEVFACEKWAKIQLEKLFST